MPPWPSCVPVMRVPPCGELSVPDGPTSLRAACAGAARVEAERAATAATAEATVNFMFDCGGFVKMLVIGRLWLLFEAGELCCDGNGKGE